MTPAQGATLANWRQHPFSIWGFQNVDRLLTTQRIAASDESRNWPAGRALDLSTIRVGDITAIDALKNTFTDGFLVLKNGALVAEQNYTLSGPSTRHILFSVTKSVTGALAGVLVDRGLLDVEKAVVHYVPEVARSAYGDCTVRHLLDMTASVRYNEDYEDKQGDVARYRAASGWDPSDNIAAPDGIHDLIATLPRGEGPHGVRFQYVSPNTDLLGWVLERASGLSSADIIAKFLWQPMGAQYEAMMTIDRRGAARTAGGLFATLSDLARFGELIRNGGRANGKVVIPGNWVKDILTGGDASPWEVSGMKYLFPRARYRSQWYVPLDQPDTLCAIGIHGQWLYIDVPTAVTAVKVSSQPIAFDEGQDRLTLETFRAVARHLGEA